jgi:serine/threonine protein kinase
MKETDAKENQGKLKRVKYDEFDLFRSSSPFDETPKKTPKAQMVTPKDRKKVDAELYFIPTIGEVLKDKYKVLSVLGKGVYSIVLEVENLVTKDRFALKVMRANEQITTAGRKELELLTLLNSTDLSERRFIIKLVEEFTMDEHLCIVIELLKRNLREHMKMIGPGKSGFPLKIVQKIGFQLLSALAHLKSHSLVHLDSIINSQAG